MKLTKILSVLLIGASAIGAQCTLTTTFAGGNNQSGNMFDVVVRGTTPVQILGFSGNLSAGTHTIEIYARTNGGGFAGVENNPLAWTLISTQVVTSAGPGSPTRLPLSNPLTIPGTAVQGLYITSNVPFSGVTQYTNGVSVGAVAAVDANIEILTGLGRSYPFAEIFSPRTWNGTIDYRTITSVCPSTPYQMNQLNAALSFDGVESNGREPAISYRTQGARSNLNVNSPLANAWDIGITNCRPIPFGQGGFRLPSGTQTVDNVFLNASFRWLGDGSFTRPALPFALPFGIAFNAPADSFSMQLAILDPSNPDIISLSQTGFLAVENRATQMPLGDDTFIAVSLQTAPYCVGPMPFAGTTFTQVFVSTNGRITFGSGDSSFSPTVFSALNGPGFVGYWTDFINFSGTGRVRSDGASVLSFEYANVLHFNTSVSNTFEVSLDTQTGELSIDGMSGIAPSTRRTFLGLSVGNFGATDAGPVASFAAGATGASAGGSMLYEFNSSGSAPSLGAVNSIRFTPIGGLDYRFITL